MTKVKIYTDASFGRKRFRGGALHKGGWAAFIWVGEAKIVISGPLLAVSNVDAEFLSIIAGLQASAKILSAVSIKPSRTILYNDCKPAVEPFQASPDNYKEKSDWRKLVRPVARKIVTRLSNLTVEWIPGHRDPRRRGALSNTVCDAQAKEAKRLFERGVYKESQAIRFHDLNTLHFDIFFQEGF